MLYTELNRAELFELKENLVSEYKKYKAMNLSLDLSRGKPGSKQLDIMSDMLDCISNEDCYSESGVDYRNYGLLDGIPEAKKLFSELLEIPEKMIFVGGSDNRSKVSGKASRHKNHGKDERYRSVDIMLCGA